MLPVSTTPPAWAPPAGLVFLAGLFAVLVAGISAPTGLVTLSLQDEPEYAAPLFTIETPDNFSIFSPEESITFRVTYEAAAGTHEMQLYVKKGAPPSADDMIDSRNVGAGHAYEFTYVPTPAWEGGRYYWKVIAVDQDGEAEELPVSSSTFTYVIKAPAATNNGTTVESNWNGSVNACSGGPGGHSSDSTGEKSFMSFTLNEGKTTVLRFNKGAVHGIEKIAVRAMKSLYPNALIIHQEFEDETNYSLPKVEAVYKTIHVHQTHVWKKDSFFATVFYRVPKSWLADKGKDMKNVHIQTYENGTWAPVPTFVASENDEYYVFQSTLNGLPPFAIGTCSNVVEGRVIQSIISGTA